jgi:membrane protein YqaA with SNARE-associated domain
MKALLPLFTTLAHFGAAGLFIVGVLDSSFLFVPLGNDLLILAFAARQPPRIVWFAACASIGSVTGAMLIDALARKGGEEGLGRFLPANRIEYIKGKVRRRAGYALAIAALLPPPFPFTPFVAASAALQYPRRRMIAVLLSARMLRFCLVGILGVAFGERILRLAEEPVVQYSVLGLFLLCVVGSAFSVYQWIHRSREASAIKRGAIKRGRNNTVKA